MNIENVLLGNMVRAENLVKSDFKDAVISDENNRDVSDALYSPLKGWKDVSYKMESDNSCCFYHRYNPNPNSRLVSEVGFRVEGATVHTESIVDEKDEEVRGFISIPSDTDSLVVTPYFAMQSSDNFELTRCYGNPVVFTGEVKAELFYDYLDSIDLSSDKGKEKIKEEIENIPLIIPEKDIHLLAFSTMSEDKRYFNATDLEDSLKDDRYMGIPHLRSFFDKGNSLFIERECYLDEQDSYRSFVKLDVKDIKVVKDRDGNRAFAFSVPFKDKYGNIQAKSKALFMKWAYDPMRDVEIEVGRDKMKEFRKNLNVFRLQGADLIDYEATNNDAENKKAGISLPTVTIPDAFNATYVSRVHKILNAVRETRDINGVFNMHLKFTHNDEVWKLKIPAKSVYSLSYNRFCSVDKHIKNKEIKDFCITLNKDETISLDIENVKNKNESILHLEGKAEDMLQFKNKSIFYDFNKQDLMENLSSFAEKNQNKVFAPINIRLSAEERRDVLYGSNGKDKFIVLRNLGEKFSARLSCSSLEIEPDGSLKASIKPVQSLTLKIDKKPIEVAVCNSRDLNRLLEINNELGQAMSASSLKADKNPKSVKKSLDDENVRT